MTRERDAPSSAAETHSRKARKWLLGLGLAAVGATLTDLATGGLSAGVREVGHTITGHTDPPPVIVSSETQRTRRSAFVFAQRLSALPPLPRDSGSVVAWSARNGGIDAFTTAVTVTVEGATTASVILLDLSIKVQERRPPPTGTLISPEGAGGIGVRYFQVDLDQPEPEPEVGELNEPRPGERPIDFPYKVSRTDPEVFVLYGNTQRCDCRWTAELHWRSGGKDGTTVIRNGDLPFRTASGSAARDQVSRDTNGRLHRSSE